MRWLAGHWKGEAFGGRTEELWHLAIEYKDKPVEEARFTYQRVR